MFLDNLDNMEEDQTSRTPLSLITNRKLNNLERRKNTNKLRDNLSEKTSSPSRKSNRKFESFVKRKWKPSERNHYSNDKENIIAKFIVKINPERNFETVKQQIPTSNYYYLDEKDLGDYPLSNKSITTPEWEFIFDQNEKRIDSLKTDLVQMNSIDLDRFKRGADSLKINLDGSDSYLNELIYDLNYMKHKIYSDLSEMVEWSEKQIDQTKNQFVHELNQANSDFEFKKLALKQKLLHEQKTLKKTIDNQLTNHEIMLRTSRTSNRFQNSSKKQKVSDRASPEHSGTTFSTI